MFQSSSSGFGSFGKKSSSSGSSAFVNEVTHPPAESASSGRSAEEEEMAKVMGFTGFGGGKKKSSAAMTFDLDSMVADATKTAKERNLEANQRLEQEAEEDRERELVRKAEEPGEGPSGVRGEKTKGSSKGDDNDDSDDDFVGPPMPVAPATKKKAKEKNEGEGDDDSDDDSDEEEEETQADKVPRSHECKLEHGPKAISALAIDPSGSRLVSGAIDYEVKFWDFAGMDSSLKSFRKVRPCESHVIKHLEYSATGDKILVVAGNAQAKVLDRDGHEVLECVKGDPYVTDMRRNKGHVGGLTGGCWHPKFKEEFLTSSMDGSMRVWLVDHKGKKTKDVIKCKSEQGLKAIPTCCCFSRDGLLVAAGCQDGSVQMWDHRKSFVNVALMMRGAHARGTDTSCIAFGYDNRHVATRGGDDTLKLWDVRSFKSPVHSKGDLFSRFESTDCCFSPDDRCVLTGTSMGRGESSGKLVFLDKATFSPVLEMEVGNSHVIRSLWHPKLNQMIVGSGDGVVRVYYDPDRSINGAKLCVVRRAAKVKQTQYVATPHIITPYSLPMFRYVQLSKLHITY